MENKDTTEHEGEQQSDNNVDVQKLKDLVKRLEKQNEHLRSRTGRLGGSTSKNSKTAKSYQTAPSSDDVINDCELECVDINNLFVDDEDETSWLYQSPVKTNVDGNSPPESRLSLQNWMLTELNNPSTPHYLAAKRNIISKLERTVPDFNLNFDGDLYHDGEFTEDESDDVDERGNRQLAAGSFRSQNSIDNEIASHKSNSSWSDDHINRDDVIMTSSHRSPSPITSLSLHHHLPIPSQTMTSAYGLVASSELDRSSIRRSLTPPKYDVTTRQQTPKYDVTTRQQTPKYDVTTRQQTPDQQRTATPVTSRPSSRRSLPASTNTQLRKNLAGNRSASPGVEEMRKSKLMTSSPGKSQLRHQPIIRSSIASPQMTSSNPQQERNSTAPPNGSGGENFTFQRSSTFTLSNPQTNSNKKQLPKRTMTSQSSMTSQVRRSLPRPSTTTVVTSSSKYGGMTSPRQLSKPRRRNDVTTNDVITDIWTNDDEVF